MRAKFIASTVAVLLVVAATAQAQQPTGRDSSSSRNSSGRDSIQTSGSQANRDNQNSSTTPIDINTATRQQLIDAGWGQYADGIIAGRPYTNMSELQSKNIVPSSAFDQGSRSFHTGDPNTMGDQGRNNQNPSSSSPSTNSPSTNSPGSSSNPTSPSSGGAGSPSR